MNLRFMDMALSQFEFIENDQVTLATDGHYLVYDPIHVLTVFKEEKEASVRDYLHVVFHCVYRHMYIHSLVNEDLWNLACDIAVEKTISELELKSVDSKRHIKQKEVIEQLQDKLKIVTAQKIYHYFFEHNLSESETAYLSSLFRADDHVFWYMDEDKKNQQLGIGTDDPNQENNRDSADHLSDQSDSNGSTESTETGGITSIPSRQQMENQWKDISEHMQMDLNTFSKQIGNQAGGLIQNLREVNRERYNYEWIL